MTHFDIAPTLMKNMLACEVNPSTYSVGLNLLNTTKRPYVLAGSYINFGIIEPDRITTIYPIGNFTIEDLGGKTLPNAKLHTAILKNVFGDTRRFYH